MDSTSRSLRLGAYKVGPCAQSSWCTCVLVYCIEQESKATSEFSRKKVQREIRSISWWVWREKRVLVEWPIFSVPIINLVGTIKQGS